MSFYNIKEVAAIALNKAVDETEEVLDAARKFYCNLHQNHPAWTVARTFSNSSLILRAIDRMCDDGGSYTPPPLPASDFTGGQCCDGSYDVFCTFVQWNADNASPAPPRTVATGGNGKVNRAYLRRNPNNSFVAYATVEFEDCNGNLILRDVASIDQGLYTGGNPPPVSTSEPFARGWHADFTTITIDTVTRTDGQPDNCGNPPAEYPPEPDPSDNQLTGTVSVTNIENNTFDYDVTVNRDTNNTINFPPSITVNNIAVSIDVTGITVGDTTNISIESGGNDSGVFPALPVPVEDENAGQELVTEPGAVEENVADLYAVIVNFTAIPFNAKISSGADAPRIIYGGWVEFKIGSDYLPREYIDFDNSVFLAPKGATGYAVTIKLGYNATITKQFYRETTDAS